MDYDVGRCTRHCATTQQQFEPGESFYSTLVVEGAEVIRKDYSEQAWQGPPEGVLGWWKSVMPTPDSRRLNLAPNEVMLELFDEWQEQEDRQDIRYVLTLLLVRRRVFRLEETVRDEQGGEQLVVYCPKRESSYQVDALPPTGERTQQIQDELANLLYADAK